MLKYITPEIHASVASSEAGFRQFTGTRFAKPGESQADAIKRYKRQMSARARAMTSHAIPRFVANATTTRDYVQRFYELNHLVVGDLSHIPDTVPVLADCETVTEEVIE